MRILLAGGAGYIGSVLVPKLLSRGYDVDVVDLLWFGNALPSGVRIVARDILEIGTADVQGYDQVVFLAGLSNDPMAEYSPGRNFVYNAACPAFLAYLAKQAGVRRYIYASSCSVYGYSVDDLCDENCATTSQFPYGISKLQGELGVLHLQDDTFSVIALRKGTVCGYSPRMRFDLVVNTMFKTALTANRITVNNPSIWGPRISGVFNVASGNYTLGELADQVDAALREHLGVRAELDIRHLEDIRNYRVDFAKARGVLGFRPAQGIEQIVRELIEHRAEFGDMDDPRYSNIASFKAMDAATTTPA
jgi:nucleoside-diphosphate-sugar epimerase